MSTLKTHNLQSPDAGSVNIAMTPNAGMVVAGLSTYSNQINIGSNIKLGTAGVVTATSFVGSGANLTSLPSQITFNNASSDRILTSNGGTAVNAEANLTFDGNNINQTIDNSGEGIRITAPNNHYSVLRFDSNVSSANGSLCNIQGHWNGNEVATIIFSAGSDTTNKDDGYIRMYTRESGQSNTERVRINSGGQVNIGSDLTQTNRTVSIASNNVGQLQLKGTEADLWLHSTGPNGVWRILGSTGTNTHRFRIYDNTNTADRFNIDSNGYIYEPAMPFGVLHGTTGWQYNGNGHGHYLLGNTASSSGGGNGSDRQLNIGWTTSGGNGATNNNFTPSNGIWTAPIAGYYVFGLKLYGLMNSNDYIQIKPCLNGTHLSETIYGYSQGSGTYMEGINETVRYYMEANDTFSWNAYGTNNAWRIYGAHCETSGYLVRGA